MNEPIIDICHTKDVHFLAIWPGDLTQVLDYNVCALYWVREHDIRKEYEMLVLIADRIANLSAETPDQLIPIIERMFPHLRAVGHPVVNDNGKRDIFESWFAYADDEGVREVNSNYKKYGYMLEVPNNLIPIG
jgi:hypothetical protein